MESTQWQIQFAKLQIANDMEMASFVATAADDATIGSCSLSLSLDFSHLSFYCCPVATICGYDGGQSIAEANIIYIHQYAKMQCSFLLKLSEPT